MKNLFTLNRYFRKYKWHLLFGICFVSISNFCLVYIPKTIGNALDFVMSVVKNPSFNQGLEMTSNFNEVILNFALVIISLALLRGVFMYFMRQTIIVMSRLIERDLRNEIFVKYESLDLSFFKNNNTGDLMARVSEDVSKVRMYLGPALLYGINLISLFIIVIYSMVNISPTLSLYTLLPLPFLSLSIYYVSQKINDRSTLRQQQLSKINTFAQEIYSGIRVVKSYVKEDAFLVDFEKQCEDYKQKSIHVVKINAYFFPLMIVMISLSTLLTIYIGAGLVFNEKISYGSLAQFVIYINYLTWPFTSIGWIASIIQEAEASQTRINEHLNQESKVQNVASSSMDNLTLLGNIEFVNVNFTYPETGIKALIDVSFSLAKGEKLAIIGKTASGKSTIAELLFRMYDVDSGQILLDGIDIKKHNLSNLRRMLAYVPQDSFLFSDTIENNIKFGLPNASSSLVKEMASHASILEDIEAFENKFDTNVGERGVTLSGGQKQRLSIARALIKKPEIIILDDSLSAVDAKTEQNILSYLNKVLQNKTGIIITHRLFSLMQFDKILVLEDGKIIEFGNHDELLSKNGYYANKYNQQSVIVED